MSITVPILRVSRYYTLLACDPGIQSDNYISSCLKQALSDNAAHLSNISRGIVACADNKSCCKTMCAETNVSP